MFGSTLDAVRGFRRPVYAVAGGRLINVFGSGLVYPFATIHFHLQVGIPLSVVGLGLLANNVATATGTAIGGYLADRYGRRPVMVGSMALSALTLAAYALVTTGTGFIAVATAAGLTTGLYAPASQAMIADLTDAGERERGYGLLKVASNVGFGSGFVVGGVLYEFASTAVFVADGLTSAVVAAVLLVALPRVHDGRAAATLSESVGDWGRAITQRRLVALAGLNVGFAIMYAQMQATVPVVASETLGLDSAQIGTLYVLNPLVLVVFQMPVLSAVGDWRRTRGLVASTAFWGVSFLAIVLVDAVPTLLGTGLVGAFLVLRTVGEVLHSPLVTSLASDLGHADERGSRLSLIEIAKRLGMGLGAALGGAFFDYGFAALLWPALIVGCAGLAVGLLALERRVSPAENGVSG
ncbi:MFS transporter [Haloplanus rubicundus]|uniref:MFS transporter n=1 Tax=Haloplanus rubicundus TaxID=1547898 RepID=A0A345E5C6_9EURY|nr:MFS transporter [Haloplanus rubicundus]AXG07398.1 MFS transporter [Haloplanus rubicundus]AXG10814.1 MFS transporter [Haloplanus rubicundus]